MLILILNEWKSVILGIKFAMHEQLNLKSTKVIVNKLLKKKIIF